MARAPILTHAQIVDCVRECDDLIMTMQDYSNRIDKNAVDRIGNPDDHAWNFVILARTASDMAGKLLMLDKLQKQKDEIERLKSQL
jgi:hypothetical protein